MKRKELVQKLMENGFSEKTLASFSDKQLATLGSKILSEVQTMTKTTDVYNSKDPNDIAKLNAALKNPDSLKDKAVEVKENIKKKKFISKEGEMSEEKKEDTPKKSSKKKPTVYDKALKDMGGEEGVIKALEKGMKGKKKEVKEELKGDQKKIDKNHNGKIDAQDFKILKGQKKKATKINEWVDSLVEKRYHPVATKNELMEAIKTKITAMEATVIPMPKKAKKGHNGIPEFMTYDAIAGAEPKTTPTEPETLPKTKPTKPAEPRENPRKSPFRKPDENPRVKPNPKAEKLQNAAE
jgi:hypothetical protein